MATKKSSKPAGKVFDIAKPGKSAPPASSKPIIITNRPLLQDPMVVPSTNDANTDAPPNDRPDTTATPPSSKIKIAPLHTSDELKKTEEATPASPAPAPAETDKAAEDSVKEPEAEESKPAEPTPDAESEPVEVKASDSKEPEKAEESEESETANAPSSTPQDTAPPADKEAAAPGESTAADASDKPAGDDPTKNATDPKADEEAARKAAEHTAEIDKLAESRKYYLPINQVEKRRNKRAALLGLVLIIILCLAWLDIALDAGILKLGNIHPVTHFFTK